MKSLTIELRLKKKIVEKLGVNDFLSSISNMYYWLLHQTELEIILDNLENIYSLNNYNKLSYGEAPMVSNLEEQACVGRNICEGAYSNLWRIAESYNLFAYDEHPNSSRILKKSRKCMFYRFGIF